MWQQAIHAGGRAKEIWKFLQTGNILGQLRSMQDHYQHNQNIVCAMSVDQ
jgi:hypothetical protein